MRLYCGRTADNADDVICGTVSFVAFIGKFGTGIWKEKG
jgi:hypothetical protein